MKKVTEANFIRTFFSTSFPNPDRTGCPGKDVLLDIAAGIASHDDPARLHLASCSPCFNEVSELKDYFRAEAARSRKHAVFVAAAVLVAASMIGGLLFTMRGHRSGSERASSGRITGASPTTGNVQGGQAKIRTQPIDVLFDIRGVAPFRDANIPNLPELFRVPARSVNLRMMLPLGSEDGEYELRIQPAGGRKAVKAAYGNAATTKGDTILNVKLDLSNLSPGSYMLAFRHADESWHRLSITITN